MRDILLFRQSIRGTRIEKMRLAVLVAGLLASSGCGSTSRQQTIAEPFPAATPQAVVTVTRDVFPAVVRLDVSESSYREGASSISLGIGSGVIFDAEGRILTNFHVAGRAVDIHVTLFNKERVRARLLGSDHWTDLAVVQMDMDEIRSRHIDFRHADFGNSDTLVPGQDVMAIGTPFGLARTLTLGTVSNVERTLYPDQLDINGYETGGYSNWIQMDVPINPGNSGGPLVDLRGRVVGINTRGGAQNLNFAVPINTAKPVIAAILQSVTPTQKGHFDRSDLGIDFKPMQDLEAFYKLDSNRGVLINGVDRFSAADRAGVQPQDVLLSVGGRPTNVRFPEELAPLRQRIATLPIGQSVELKLKRGDDLLSVTAVTERLQGSIGEAMAVGDWGLSVQEVTRAFANDKQLDSASGMVVTTVTPDLPAAKSGLQPGDVIDFANGEALADLPAFRRVTESVQKNPPETLLLNIRRGRGRRSVVLKLPRPPIRSTAEAPATTIPATTRP